MVKQKGEDSIIDGFFDRGDAENLRDKLEKDRRNYYEKLKGKYGKNADRDIDYLLEHDDFIVNEYDIKEKGRTC